MASRFDLYLWRLILDVVKIIFFSIQLMAGSLLSSGNSQKFSMKINNADRNRGYKHQDADEKVNLS